MSYDNLTVDKLNIDWMTLDRMDCRQNVYRRVVMLPNVRFVSKISQVTLCHEILKQEDFLTQESDLSLLLSARGPWTINFD